MVKLTNGEIDAETCYNEIKQASTKSRRKLLKLHFL